jgi:hypothetical protein
LASQAAWQLANGTSIPRSFRIGAFSQYVSMNGGLHVLEFVSTADAAKAKFSAAKR